MTEYPQWAVALREAWYRRGKPPYRVVGANTGLNHETVRQALNGNSATSFRTLAALAAELCEEGESSAVIDRWQRSQASADPLLEPVPPPPPGVEWILIPDYLHGPISDLMAVFKHDMRQVNETTWAVLPREESDR